MAAKGTKDGTDWGPSGPVTFVPGSRRMPQKGRSKSPARRSEGGGSRKGGKSPRGIGMHHAKHDLLLEGLCPQ